MLSNYKRPLVDEDEDDDDDDELKSETEALEFSPEQLKALLPSVVKILVTESTQSGTYVIELHNKQKIIMNVASPEEEHEIAASHDISKMHSDDLKQIIQTARLGASSASSKPLLSLFTLPAAPAQPTSVASTDNSSYQPGV